MEKSKIDWCDSTWNPVTGCLHGCEYCYAKGIVHRFGGFTELEDTDLDYEKICGNNIVEIEKPLKYLNNKGKIGKSPYPFFFKPTLYHYKLNEPQKWKKGRNIFVCSMADLFGSWVPDSWIEEVFKACEEAPQHNYLFLTKNPQRYVELQDKKMLPQKGNMWYGTSVTDEKSLKVAAGAFEDMKIGINSFFSIEPILEDITNSETWSDCVKSQYMDWVIIGAEMGRRKGKITPDRAWIRSIAFDCDENWGKIPVFMKSSLTEIWGEPLIQEFPKELKRSGTVRCHYVKRV